MRLKKQRKPEYKDFLQGIEDALPALRAFARSLTGCAMSADDLVQSSCERALERADQVNNIKGLKSWLNRIIYTQWQDTLRKQKVQKISSSNVSDVSSTYGSRHIEESYIAKLDIERALEQLSPDHRAAVVLVSMLGYGYEEASEILEVPTGTVASRVARGRIILAQHLSTRKNGKNDKEILPREALV